MSSRGLCTWKVTARPSMFTDAQFGRKELFTDASGVRHTAGDAALSNYSLRFCLATGSTISFIWNTQQAHSGWTLAKLYSTASTIDGR